MRGRMPMYEYMDHGYFWVGHLFQLLIVAVIVAGVVLAVRAYTNRTGHAARGTPPSRGALDILEERFARGEVDEQEFRARRDALRG